MAFPPSFSSLQIQLSMMETETRKDEHLGLFKQLDLSITEKTSGFERWDWIPAETADIDFDSINTETSFLAYPLSFPFMITAISGGSKEGDHLNEILASCAETEKIPLATGSVRSLLEKGTGFRTIKQLRDRAPHIPLITNIGIAQTRDRYIRKSFLSLTRDGNFDAVAVHFNKIQELIQPEGDKNFTGIMEALSQLAEEAGIPVIVKQVGHGFSQEDFLSLWEAGIRFLDVSGTGGSSWAKAERIRRGNHVKTDPFDAWGVPTADCLTSALDVCPGMYCIAGGGIKTGHDLAKSLALGAQLASSANTIYQAYLHGGQEGVLTCIRDFREILKKIMFLTGCSSLNSFRRNPHILRKKND